MTSNKQILALVLVTLSIFGCNNPESYTPLTHGAELKMEDTSIAVEFVSDKIVHVSKTIDNQTHQSQIVNESGYKADIRVTEDSIIPFIWDDSQKTLTVENRSGKFDGMVEKRILYVSIANMDTHAGMTLLEKNTKIIEYYGEELSIQL